MHRKMRMAVPLLFSTALLSACYKGDGTEDLSFPEAAAVPVKVDPELNSQLDAMFTDLTLNPNAPSETPFPFDAPEEPEQDILLVMLYDNTEKSFEHLQSVNYFDKYGRAYCYRDAVDADGDWFTPLLEHYQNGANPVSLMSDAERDTLWYLAAHAAEYAALPEVTADAGSVVGETAVYLMDETGSAIRLGCWADESVWRGSMEITDFLNWFRYYFRYGFEFGQAGGKK